MSNIEWEWASDKAPPEPGWYPALICYEIEEGLTPFGIYWDGSGWMNHPGLTFGWLPRKFSNKAEASEEASAQNPEFKS